MHFPLCSITLRPIFLNLRVEGQPQLEFNIELDNQYFIFLHPGGGSPYTRIYQAPPPGCTDCVHPGGGIVIALYYNKKASFYASITDDARKAVRRVA